MQVKVNLEHLWHNVEIDSSLIFLKKKIMVMNNHESKRGQFFIYLKSRNVRLIILYKHLHLIILLKQMCVLFELLFKSFSQSLYGLPWQESCKIAYNFTLKSLVGELFTQKSC